MAQSEAPICPCGATMIRSEGHPLHSVTEGRWTCPVLEQELATLTVDHIRRGGEIEP